MIQKWNIYVDTGGTFTDCLGVNPDGKQYRFKVLSSGCLRGKIIEKVSPGVYKVWQSWGVERDIFKGYRFCILNENNNCVEVVGFNARESLIELMPEPATSIDGYEFEISAGEEAPVLATRLVTQTALNQDFPILDMRLGSTRGTNALLERKGVPVLLLTTKGFADLTVIGTQQRSDLFALNIVKPGLLFDNVIEVDERILHSGEIKKPLTESYINTILQKIFQAKPRVVVIAFLNSYINPVHEKIFANLLRTAGYKFVCASHELQQSIKFLDRTQTSLVNAYLMPVLTTYHKNVKAAVGNTSTLKIMTSSAGLIDAAMVHPKDCLLSGPAGGVAGAVAIAGKLGIGKVISFDMGGTSTDVSRYDGRFDYVFETRVGEQSILSPSLNIETVAAGGGSVCSFDGFKFTVGPESAGAFPGPAAYGAGGPLAITDIDLLMGRTHSACYSIPIDRTFSAKALENLKSKYPLLNSICNDDILRGFFEIANEHMAKAITKISVRAGYDPSSYTLLSFGGAGGMHVCAIASHLNINRIVIPYDAGILSAYGIGNSSLLRVATKQILKPLDEVIPTIEAIIDNLIYESFDGLKKEGAADDEIRHQQTILLLRLKGQEEPIEITYSSPELITSNFREAYQKLYGHYIENRTIELESIKVFSEAGNIQQEMVRPTKNEYIPEANNYQQSLSTEGWEETPIFKLDLLNAGAYIQGPAVILHSTSTSFIDKGWEARVNRQRDLICSHTQISVSHNEKSQPEAVQLELFTNRFGSIALSMGALLQRTSFSVNIRERLDFSCALLDSDGFQVVNAPHIPVHLGALGLCTRLVSEKLPMHEDDVIITNHPAFGGSHLPDVTLIAPVYVTGNLVGYVINRAHHSEIGGIAPGSMPANARNLEEEGVVIAPCYLARKGNVNYSQVEQLLQNAKYPSRSLTENMADIQAAYASILLGKEQLIKMCETFGTDKVKYYMKALRQYASDCVSEKITRLIKEPLSAQEKLDDGSMINVIISLLNEKIVFDFSDTSPTHPMNMNATPAIVQSVVLYVLRLLIDEEIPLNEGMLDKVNIKIPVCMLNPVFSDNASKSPAVVGGNVEVSQRLVDTLLKAFGVAACSQGTMNNLLFGNNHFGYYETICGGVGAGKGFIGASGVHQHMTNTRITDPEVLEKRFPVTVEEFSIRKNSGGTGMWKGGDGVVRRIRFLEDVEVTLLSQHRNYPPYGLLGGNNGICGEQYVVAFDGSMKPVDGIGTYKLSTGEAVEIRTPGGGGYGL